MGMMDFFMPCWKKTDRSRQHRCTCLWCVLLLAMLLTAPFGAKAAASSATFTSAHAEIREGVVYLDLDFKLVLDRELIQAMRHAIPIDFSLLAVIESPREGWFPEKIISDRRHYRLGYHALSNTWLVTDTLEHEARSFSTLEGALHSLERVRAWPVVRAKRLIGYRYLVGKVRMVLDYDRLPLPLRLPALFDSRWTLKSHWFDWRVPTVSVQHEGGE